MITLNKYGNRENRVWLELYGLSTDEKPIEKFDDIFIGNSSTYYEMDTKNTFMYEMDIITLAAAKKYTKETAEGLGAIKGQDGVSPTISVEDIDGGHRVTIQDKDGIKSFEVLNGDGENIKPISNEEIENLFK